MGGAPERGPHQWELQVGSSRCPPKRAPKLNTSQVKPRVPNEGPRKLNLEICSIAIQHFVHSFLVGCWPTGQRGARLGRQWGLYGALIPQLFFGGEFCNSVEFRRIVGQLKNAHMRVP